jgi:hypothetical protein
MDQLCYWKIIYLNITLNLKNTFKVFFSSIKNNALMYLNEEEDFNKVN